MFRSVIEKRNSTTTHVARCRLTFCQQSNEACYFINILIFTLSAVPTSLQNQCQHGGTLVEHDSSFKCFCERSFTGVRCESKYIIIYYYVTYTVNTHASMRGYSMSNYYVTYTVNTHASMRGYSMLNYYVTYTVNTHASMREYSMSNYYVTYTVNTHASMREYSMSN